MAISEDGKTLFVSSLATVYAYPYDASAGTVGEPKSVITGMSNGGHSTRTLLVPVTAPNTLLISRGSDGNIDNTTIEAPPPRSVIKMFNIDEIMAAPNGTDFDTNGVILGAGLRNSVGVGEDASTGGIVSCEKLSSPS